MRILVVSWGDFERWKEIKYRFGNETSVGPSTLPILQKVLRPDWTVVIIPDTLGRNFESVEALRDDVRNRALDFLEKIGAGREVDVVIVPGIGEFSNGTFRGNAMDAYHYLLHRLSEILPPRQNLDVHFDSTHGLNYITLLAYRALKELLGISAITNEVTFTAYNSDPVPKAGKELTINVIERATIRPSPLDSKLPSSKGEYLGNYSLPGPEYGRVLGSLEELRELVVETPRLNAWIASVLYGFPLVFASYYPGQDTIENVLGGILEVYLDSIEVSTQDRRVERILSLGSGFGTLAKLAYQRKVLSMDNLPKGEPSIKELRDITERVFRGRIRESTKTELHRLATSVKDDTSGWIRYSELLKRMGKIPNPQVDPRNFLAHAGLEANLIEVKRDGDLYIRYTSEEVIYGGRPVEPDRVIASILTRSLEES